MTLRPKMSMTALANANAELVIENSDLKKKIATLEAALKKHAPGYNQAPATREFRTSFQGSVVPDSVGLNHGRPSYDLIAPNGYIRKVITENEDIAAKLERHSGEHVNFVCEIRPTGMWVKDIGSEVGRFTLDGVDPNADHHATQKKHFGITEKGLRLKIVSLPGDQIDQWDIGSDLLLKGTFIPVNYGGKYFTQFFTQAALEANMSYDPENDAEITF
jgi:hypothetical protein